MPKILVIAFFPAFSPPTSGGELRLLNLYRALSATHDVTLLTSTDFGARFEDIKHGPRFREVRFPKDQLWRDAYATLDRAGVSGELSGLAFALAVSDPACRLRQLARELEPTVDVVIHEFPFSEPIFADGSSTKEIYNAHNFEASLLGSIVSGEGFDAAVGRLLRLEANLVARVGRVFATAEADAEKFRLVYGVEPARLRLCPNGFDTVELERVVAHRAGRVPRERPALLFMGSAHAPNVEAARFLVDLARSEPAFNVILAGGVAESLGKVEASPNLFLVGRFDDQGKIDLLANADIFVNPVTLGSGTSLKAIEALGAGVPLVSTAEGVRGLDIVADRDAVIVTREGFAAALHQLAADPARRERMAASGRETVTERYAWPRIAAALGADFTADGSDAAEKPQRPLAIALNDYPVGGPRSGGRTRIKALLSHLDCDVVLLSFGATFDVRFLTTGVLEVTVPKSAAHKRFETAVNEGQINSADDCVAALFVAANRVLVQVLALLLPRAGVAIFEHCYMAAALDQIGAERPDLPIVYSAHNVEAEQKATLLRAHPAQAGLVALTADLEAALVRRAQLIVCCTGADAGHFAKLAPRVATIVVANGCDLPASAALAALRAAPSGQPSARPRVGFLGSSHGPNADALAFVVRDLAPAFPDVDFEAVGGACTTVMGPLPPNVTLHGLVGDAEKTAIEAGWTLALNPVTTGGGSSLKLPDYMAHGLPTLSTEEGARGFDVAGRDVGQVATLAEFRNALGRLLADGAALARQGRNASRYAAEALSWPALTAPYGAALHALLRPGPGVPADGGLSVLVVTYRYTEPALGGAEDYLVEVLARLRSRVGRLDLAAIDIGALTNHHHFGARFETTSGAATRLGALFDRAVYFAPDTVPHDELIERTRRLEAMWFREEFDLLLGFQAEIGGATARLLAGFFPPERQGDLLRRWTAPVFSLLLPKSCAGVRLVGNAAAEKTLTVTVAQLGPDKTLRPLARHALPLQPWFTINLALPEAGRGGLVILLLETEEHHGTGDHRPLGLLLEQVSVLVEPAPDAAARGTSLRSLDEQVVDLAEDHERGIRSRDPDRWIEALRAVAVRRPQSGEDDFARTRGPHSAAMQRFLAEEAQRYDTVLVQGIPFDVVPSTVATVSSLAPRPRLVVLPHFHGDDRFYHWRRYFESFERADATLVFSPTLAARLASPEKLVVVPGGGVDPDEHGDRAASDRFRDLHPSRRPFYLVLGRKTGSKGYRRIIAAHAGLARRVDMPDLVLIGPDEDGLAVAESGVAYLGRQPRDVVRGALAACLGLITMSESESFGIVICEAWLFGKPVIANGECLSFSELVRDGETGLLVRSDAELTRAMWRLAQDPAERRRLGQAGLVRVREDFAWDRVADGVFATLLPP